MEAGKFEWGGGGGGLLFMSSRGGLVNGFYHRQGNCQHTTDVL